MIFKLLRKKLDLNWIKKNDVWDIVVYGSYVRGKLDASDIDIAIVTKKVEMPELETLTHTMQ